MISVPFVKTASALGLAAMCCSSAWTLERPSPQQLERYRQDGTLAQRIAAAESIGNHRLAPHLAARVMHPAQPGKTAAQKSGLLSIGNQNVLAILIAFEDYSGFTDAATVDDQLFGDGYPEEFPTDSLRNFYRRSSYGLLEIGGSTLGWYTTPYPRSEVEETMAGREALIRETILHFDTEGHDFSQYDNDGDGVIDYLVVIWAGPHQDWAEFWWGYQTHFQDSAFSVDGVGLDAYSWQWENYSYPGPFSPLVVIHETGHALGLPDFYDYDESVGPSGGVGGLDQMDGNWGDHNCYSKWLLGWLQPQVFNQDTHQLLLAATGEVPEAALLMHGDPQQDPWDEYFMVQYRRRQENDVTYPTDGLLVWHVDARRSPSGYLLYNNSYTEHKLLRLMEADGLEEIERNQSADAGDFYTPGDVFGVDTEPNSDRYDGSPTNLVIEAITSGGQNMGLQASLGSGCAIFCEATAAETGWPRIPIPFQSTTAIENCDGDPVGQWQFGDLGIMDETATAVVLTAGTHPWNFTAELGEASCNNDGEITVCADERCQQWRPESEMAAPRALHLSIALDDGKTLVAGGGGPLEIFDPYSGTWQSGADLDGDFEMARGALLPDGRVLVVGSTAGDTVNAEIYDPGSDACTCPDQMSHDRTWHSAVGLDDGRVLVAGGSDPDSLEPVLEIEIFNPDTGHWSDAGLLPEAMELPGLSVMGDGRVLLTGSQAYMTFDPTTDLWSEPGRLVIPRLYHVSLSLNDGRVLLIGGSESNYLTVFDPATNREGFAGRMGAYRILPTAVELESGRILVAGGMDPSYVALATAELLEAGTFRSQEIADMADARMAHQMTLLETGEALVTGGVTVQGDGSYLPTANVERYARPAIPPLRPSGRVVP